MRDLVLPDKLDSGRSWTEELPPGVHQRSSASFGADSAQIVLNFKMYGSWRNLAFLVKYVCGYSSCVTVAGGAPFDASNPAAQGPYRLARQAPARHPMFPNLRATKILSVQGVGLDKRFVTDDLDVEAGNDIGPGEGHVANWEFYYVSIQFEIPRYPILNDDELAGRKEYLRYTEFLPETTVETQARRGELWVPCMGGGPVGVNSFNGDRTLRIPKGTLTVKWYDVALDYIYLGRLIPTNLAHRLSTCNAAAFPGTAYRDQNKADGTYVQYQPGALLLSQPKILQRTQNHPAVLAGEIDPLLFPRTVDLEIPMLIFDPPSTDTSTINLSGNDVFGFAMNGAPAQLIRGWNLAPTPMPVAGNQWWAWRKVAAGTNITTVPAANPTDMTELLYTYSSFETLFAAPESQTP